jgi:serine/threonine protein phosphatase 1
MRMIDVTKGCNLGYESATVVYAIGDIHGRLDLLEGMQGLIAADIARTRPASPLICYLGDYVDRGPNSAQVIETLAKPRRDGIGRIFLKGNHEDRMIEVLDDPSEKGPAWMQFGGREALQSYGVVMPKVGETVPWPEIRDDLAGRLPAHHLHFLKGLVLAFRWRDYLFVHAGLHPERPLNRQSAHDVMWIREPFLSSDRDWGVTVVHGHVIEPAIIFRPNRIGIDTGAYKTGRLTSLVLGDGAPRLLQTGP